LTFELAVKNKDGISLLYSPKMLSEERILVVFTTRQGGVSPKPFDSLNLGFHVGDYQNNVEMNREHLLSDLNLNINRLTTAEQVHGNIPTIIEEDLVGRGARSYADSIPGTDALITAVENVPLALFFADCVPIILVDPKMRRVAIIHAGRRGIVGNIISNTITTLIEHYGTRASDLIAFIGPSIGECCYEVSEELQEQFKKRFDVVANNARIDLPGYAEMELKEKDIPTRQIIRSNFCTSCRNDLFFSYRREQTTGRQAGIVVLLGKDYKTPL